MGLIGNIIAIAFAGNPATINYSMFTATFGLLSLFYLIPATVKESFHIPIVTIVLDGLNTIFFFCAAVALAAKLGAHSCNNTVSGKRVFCHLIRMKEAAMLFQ